ncbi:hypothetical protein BB048_20430 [Vibrio parahaemolyticus]|nr:hypothetical protein BB048_20430 [Vibrio parahaemolyticus]
MVDLFNGLLITMGPTGMRITTPNFLAGASLAFQSALLIALTTSQESLNGMKLMSVSSATISISLLVTYFLMHKIYGERNKAVGYIFAVGVTTTLPTYLSLILTISVSLGVLTLIGPLLFLVYAEIISEKE